jgi:multiple sugar transport system substrate-binding protein
LAVAAAGSLAALGCGDSGPRPPANAPPTFPGVKLVVAAVGDPAILSTLSTLKGDWTSSRQAELTVREKAVEPKDAQGVDVLIFRGDLVGDLVDVGALAVIPETSLHPQSVEDSGAAGDRSQGLVPSETPTDRLQFPQVAAIFRDKVSKYGKDRSGLPYGGSALVLVYQRDAFEKEPNKQAAQQAKIDLKPPTTWTQLDALAQFLQGRDWNGDGKPDHGISLALGLDPEGLGDATYLARAASLGMHPNNFSFLFHIETMAPLIDSPPFVEALEALAALRASGPPGVEKFDADQARDAFRNGSVALLIDRAERVSRWSDAKHQIGVAPLPGSERVYNSAAGRQAWEQANPPNAPAFLPFGGGWLVGVAKGLPEDRREAAIDFAKYLNEPETSNRVRADTSFPMLPVRGAQMSQGPDPRAAGGVDGKQWSEAIRQTYIVGRGAPGLRIPGTAGYLADLAQARQAVAEGKLAASAALQEAAKAWSERTQKLGVQRQRAHYRRSLDPTLEGSSELPPRG